MLSCMLVSCDCCWDFRDVARWAAACCPASSCCMRIWDWALNWDQVWLPEGLASTCRRHQVHVHKS